MQVKNMGTRPKAIIILSVVCLLSAGAIAQETRSEVSVQGTGFFTKDTSGQGVFQRGTETGGVLGGYRYHFNHWLSAEADYGWNRNSQLFSTPTGFGRVQADVHQVTGGLVVNLPSPHVFKARPYVLAGGGALIFNPTNTRGTVPGATTQAEGAFVYGGGADFPLPLIRQVALRLEYRGLVYDAPNFGVRALSTGSVTHTAEPSAGLVFRF